jgi:hypothetical protein
MTEFVRNNWNEKDANGGDLGRNVEEKEHATISEDDGVDVFDLKKNIPNEEPFLVSKQLTCKAAIYPNRSHLILY